MRRNPGASLRQWTGWAVPAQEAQPVQCNAEYRQLAVMTLNMAAELRMDSSKVFAELVAPGNTHKVEYARLALVYLRLSAAHAKDVAKRAGVAEPAQNADEAASAPGEPTTGAT